MPYTPPTHRSPTSSAVVSPEASRRPSVQTGSRPSLPRSASYLTKQPRRNNSWSERAAEKESVANTLLNGSPRNSMSSSSSGLANQTTPPGTSEDLQSLVTGSNAVIRQSPPPVTNGRSIPKGAIISPPESPNSSSDESEEITRGRQIDNPSLRQLQEALMEIPQQRSMSPPRKASDDMQISPTDSTPLPKLNAIHTSFSTGSLTGLSKGTASASCPRRIAHSKSKTEPKIVFSASDVAIAGSEEESDGESQKKPAMVRKKSGELVRPALRPSSRRRPSSMPGTPTFAKAVHFDSHLEHVRHFCDLDRPAAVSAGSSPVDIYDTDDEFPFPTEPQAKRTPPFEWELALTNFPSLTDSRRGSPVRMERVWLSSDQKSLMGSVVVANIAFQKQVTCRFTLDYWKTTSEVVADYSQEVHPRETATGHDRFTFNIKLSDTANLENKTLYFCVRYNVGGVEHWDNNSNANFQVDFKKKMLPQNGKRGFHGVAPKSANALPRSNRRAHAATNRGRSSAMNGLDEFRLGGDKVDRKSIHEVLGESGSMPELRLKGVKSTTSIPSDNLSNGLGSPSGQAFSNRYDFGASLSAAKQAAKNGIPKSERDPDSLYMKPIKRGEAANAAKARMNGVATDPARRPHHGIHGSPMPYPPSTMATSSYEELVNKYCFYGSKQSNSENKADKPPLTMTSTTTTTPPPKVQISNAKGDAARSRSASSSSTSSSSSTDGPELAHSLEPTAQHHSLYPVGSGQYFYSAPLSLSPSPLNTPATLSGSRSSSPSSLANNLKPLAATPIIQG